MPELPEVETIRRQLSKEIVGRRISSVDVFFAKRLNVPAKKFIGEVSGRRVRDVRRRAKVLLIDLSGGLTMAVHLKMTGRLLLTKKADAPTKHTHLVFGLSGGRRLMFEDVRKFGWVRLFETAAIEDSLIGPMELGPEPFDAAFTPESLAKCLSSRGNSRIKPLIMSQRCVAGSGNIYTDEALWKARIRPDRKAGTLTRQETVRLHAEIRSVLKEAIKRRGSSVDDYVDAYGRPGTYEMKHEAYGRGGEKCARCGGLIRKVRLGGRGTHYCPKCQR